MPIEQVPNSGCARGMLNKEETMLRLKMQHLALLTSVWCVAVAHAAHFEITPAIQAELDRQKAVVAIWAAEQTVVQLVLEQNSKGPIAGMDNASGRRCGVRILK